MIEVVARIPTAKEYTALREAAGWKVPPLGDCAVALAATVLGAVAEVGGETIAMGRTVGDGAFYSFVVDLVVRPDHQRAGVGSRLLSALVEETARRSLTGTIGLVAEQELAAFYEGNGFLRGSDGFFSKRLAAPSAGRLAVD